MAWLNHCVLNCKCLGEINHVNYVLFLKVLLKKGRKCLRELKHE